MTITAHKLLWKELWIAIVGDKRAGPYHYYEIKAKVFLFVWKFMSSLAKRSPIKRCSADIQCWIIAYD